MNSQDYKYVFYIVPDLAIVHDRTYLVYRKNSKKPIGYMICNQENYEAKFIPDLLLSEELALFDACEKFYNERFRSSL